MNFVALRMLTGDRAKYFGLVFAVAFCTFLLENQTAIFANIMRRTASQILDVPTPKSGSWIRRRSIGLKPRRSKIPTWFACVACRACSGRFVSSKATPSRERSTATSTETSEVSTNLRPLDCGANDRGRCQRTDREPEILQG
jgi:hypothetical protein